MFELVGYRYCEIEAKSKNEQDMIGYSCHFLMDEIDKEFVGRSGFKVFLSRDKFPDFMPQIGNKYLLILSPKAKVIGIQELDG